MYLYSAWCGCVCMRTVGVRAIFILCLFAVKPCSFSLGVSLVALCLVLWVGVCIMVLFKGDGKSIRLTE